MVAWTPAQWPGCLQGRIFTFPLPLTLGDGHSRVVAGLLQDAQGQVTSAGPTHDGPVGMDHGAHTVANSERQRVRLPARVSQSLRFTGKSSDTQTQTTKAAECND